MIDLTEEEISNLSRSQAEEKLLYVRYLLMREKKNNLLKIYNGYSELLEERITALTGMEGNGGTFSKEA
jgi:hypothetical protein